MKYLTQYHLSRLVIMGAISLIFAWSGMPWWLAGLVFVLGAVFFLWAPLSGRYRVVADTPTAPLRLDERARQVRDRAGRTAFQIMELLTLSIFLYGQFQTPPLVSTAAVGGLLGIGMLSYLVLTLWYERASIKE